MIFDSSFYLPFTFIPNYTAPPMKHIFFFLEDKFSSVEWISQRQYPPSSKDSDFCVKIIADRGHREGEIISAWSVGRRDIGDPSQRLEPNFDVTSGRVEG